jgi:hypothetical protein
MKNTIANISSIRPAEANFMKAVVSAAPFAKFFLDASKTSLSLVASYVKAKERGPVEYENLRKSQLEALNVYLFADRIHQEFQSVESRYYSLSKNEQLSRKPVLNIIIRLNNLIQTGLRYSPSKREIKANEIPPPFVIPKFFIPGHCKLGLDDLAKEIVTGDIEKWSGHIKIYEKLLTKFEPLQHNFFMQSRVFEEVLYSARISD